MKILSAAVLAISCIPSSVAFVSNNQKSIKTQLNLNDEDRSENSWDHMVGPAVTGLAGLSVASHIAVAATFDPASVEAMSPETSTAPTVLRQGTSQQVFNVRF